MKNKIIDDMLAADYHKIEALSASGAKQLLKTPAHYLSGKTFRQPTKAMILGTAVHTLVLEPEKFDDEIIVSPKFDMRTKFGKQAREEFEEASKGKLVLDEYEFDKARGISDSLRSHPFFKEHVKGGKAETTMLWEQYGVQCKARVDYVANDVIYDVKTCQDASPNGFAKQIANFQYHVQAAHYLIGLNKLREVPLETHRFVFLAVESSPPYACGIYTITAEGLTLGAALMKRAAAAYTKIDEPEATLTKHYNTEAESLVLPSWAFSGEQIE